MFAVRPKGSHPRKPHSGFAATSASIFGMVEANHRYLGSFHQRLNRSPMMKTTKSPSIEAVMRRLMVTIGGIVPQPNRRFTHRVRRTPLALQSCLVAKGFSNGVRGASEV